MIIERSKNGNVTAFQQLKPAGAGIKKVGFICEAESVAEAMNGVVLLVAQHCTATGNHPANILEGVEIK